jgi:CubicO group peptidase (beta-lactamase class C family)
MKIFHNFGVPSLVACLLASSAGRAHAGEAPPGAPAEGLAGLWKARRWFGPEARGPLIIERAPGGWAADFVGRALPVRLDGAEVAFELPNGQGAFRGRLQEGGALHGHWYPPNSAGLRGGRFKYASPVWFEAEGPDRWRGEVVPFEDAFTLYLLVQERPDGTLGAYLRNPERNLGFALGVDRLDRDGDVVKLIGKRQGRDESEVAVGTYDRGKGKIRMDFPANGGTYDFARDGDQSDFYPRGKGAGRYAYRPPPARDDGWPTGTLEGAGIDQAGIEKFIQVIIDRPMESVHTPQVHGVLIARSGKLVLEEYFHGEHRDKLHETRSAAKSVIATMVGAAIQAGAKLDASSRVYEVMNGGAFPPGLEERKRALTLEHLLTMSSGYFCDDADPDAPGNEDAMFEQEAEPDYYRYALGLPMASAPGEQAVYCSTNPNLALGVLSRATGESPLHTFDRLLGAPMKIRRYGWGLDPAGNPYGGGSVQFLPRDMMKFGQLMLDGGTWQGRRILARDFADRASAPLRELRGLKYGYLWWVIDHPYKDRTVRAYFANGNGGQGVTVIPELDLVIATYAGSYGDSAGTHIRQEFPPKYILPAVRERGAP